MSPYEKPTPGRSGLNPQRPWPAGSMADDDQSSFPESSTVSVREANMAVRHAGAEINGVASDEEPAEFGEAREKTHFSLEGIAFDVPEATGGCGRYQLDHEFSRGAMGAIYRGFDTHLGREVALKFLLNEHRNNPELRERFLQEARITSRLQHPGVVPVYDLHRAAGNGLFFTMMFVHGVTLKELLKKRATASSDLSRFLAVFERICQTMAYVHTQGVIHRDLKPSNIMVGEFGVVRVMDWGLAKVLVEPRPPRAVESIPEVAGCACAGENSPLWQRGPPLKSPGSLGGAMGTPAYMGPEQARGQCELIDQRADVFGLGAVLCEILTGRPPYVGRTAEDLYQMARKPALEDAIGRLDRCIAEPKLVMLAKDCLNADRDARPQNAGEVAAIMTAQLESDLQRTALDMVRFFELSHDLFCLANMDGYFQRVNDNFPKVLGYSKSELMARPFLDFVHPDDLGQTLVQMDKLARGLPVVCFKNRYRDVAGQYHLFEWTAKSLPEEGVIFAVARAEMPVMEGLPV